MQTASALLSKIPAVREDAEAMSLLEAAEGCCNVLNKCVSIQRSIN